MYHLFERKNSSLIATTEIWYQFNGRIEFILKKLQCEIILMSKKNSNCKRITGYWWYARKPILYRTTHSLGEKLFTPN